MFVGFRVHQETAQAVQSGTWTEMLFDHVDLDVGGFRSGGAGAYVLTVPADGAGVYLVSGHVVFEDMYNNADYRARVVVVRGGVELEVLHGLTFGAGLGNYQMVDVAGSVAFQAGDGLRFDAMMQAGGGTFSWATPPLVSWFEGVYVG